MRFSQRNLLVRFNNRFMERMLGLLLEWLDSSGVFFF